METNTNSKKPTYSIDNILICWNPGDYSKQLCKDGYKVATSYAEFKDKYKGPDTIREQSEIPDKRKKKQESVEVRIDGLVVLCELTWGLSTEKANKQSAYSAMSGIEFVKERRRQKMTIPVVFVSFLSRAQQLKLSTTNEIISTPALGHFYEQLPSRPESWIETLNKFDQKLLSDPELEDIKSHFCDPEGMLGELKHDLRKYLDSTDIDRSKKFEVVFRRIEDIVGQSCKSSLEQLKKLQHISDEDYNEKIEKISRAIDNFIQSLKPDKITKIVPDNSIEVVFLDDEMNTDKRFETLLQLIRKNNLVVHPFTDPDEAFKKVENDKENHIQIIITDNRIWNNSKNSCPRLMDQMQGYTFLKKCSDLGRTYTYVVLSALPRNFLMHQYGLRTETLYKNGVLANEYSMLNFIRNLMDWGEANKNSLATKFSANPNFIAGYNWYRDRSGRKSIDAEIYNKIANIIPIFNSKVLWSVDNCVSKPGKLDCTNCKIYTNLPKKSADKFKTLTDFRSNYSRLSWNPLKKTDTKNLKNKFAVRRLFFFYVFSLRKYNCLLAEDIADNLVDRGYIKENGDYKLTCSLEAYKTLWITKNNVESHVTPEDAEFLNSLDLIDL